jgi:IS66 Orf2 like protein
MIRPARSRADATLFFFVFRPKRGDRVKILVWDGSGLVLFWKRLEQGACRPGQWPPVVIRDKFSAAAFWEDIGRYDCTMFRVVPLSPCHHRREFHPKPAV